MSTIDDLLVEKDYMKFAFKFHRVMSDKQLTLAYEGEVNQSVLTAFTSLAKHKMEQEDEDHNVKKRVFHVMVECLQNICKHTDDPITGEAKIPGNGTFLVQQQDDEYFITAGNPINSNKVDELKNAIDNINQLDREGLKALHKRQLQDVIINESSGAGLGLIDIARKTGQKLGYYFEPISENTSFFLLTIKVLR